MNNDVKLGIGLASGMFFHAPAGTALPSYPGADLSAWTEIGDITEDGITFSSARDYTALKNWALKIKRLLPGTDAETIEAPIMDTTKEVFKTIFGAENVKEIAATSQHGTLLEVDTDTLNTPTAEAFLFIMKDGDDMIMIGTTEGYITSLGDISFKPNEGITWSATISGKFKIVTDDGQIES